VHGAERASRVSASLEAIFVFDFVLSLKTLEFKKNTWDSRLVQFGS